MTNIKIIVRILIKGQEKTEKMFRFYRKKRKWHLDRENEINKEDWRERERERKRGGERKRERGRARENGRVIFVSKK
jgi:hypothetical protein